MTTVITAEGCMYTTNAYPEQLGSGNVIITQGYPISAPVAEVIEYSGIKRSHRKIHIWLGALVMAICFILVALEIAAIRGTRYGLFSPIVVGFWVSAILFVTGLLCVLSGRYESRGCIIAALIFDIIAFSCTIGGTASAFANGRYYAYADSTLSGLRFAQGALCIISMLLVFVDCIYCCNDVCECYDNQGGVVIVRQQQPSAGRMIVQQPGMAPRTVQTGPPAYNSQSPVYYQKS